MREGGTLTGLADARYARWDAEFGRDILGGRHDIDSLPRLVDFRGSCWKMGHAESISDPLMRSVPKGMGVPAGGHA